ncbi:hypothetical protein [Colwellia sp. UCD-KL20]|uniref:hypothetical protein n=1 Tax=Colwellia sp. UCD-KL20 TaxID=1917165 RepID=UPI001C4DC382|nr:hypothetical protein [Colwellia sp. UCD-KL20]
MDKINVVKRLYQLFNIKINNIRITRFGFMRCLLFFILNSLVSLQVSANDLYAVFTLSSDFEPLTKSKVIMLFRGKTKYLQGKKIELSDWPQNNNIRHEFYQKLLGKDLAQMNAYWARLSFSGKARPPKEIDNGSVESLVEWLAVKRFRIGYAPIDLLPANANVLYIVKKEKS